jgi:hypothetical protein
MQATTPVFSTNVGVNRRAALDLPSLPSIPHERGEHESGRDFKSTTESAMMHYLPLQDTVRDQQTDILWFH